MMSISEIGFQFNFWEDLLAQQGAKRFHLPPPKITVMLMPFSDLGKLQMVVLLVQEQESHTGQKEISWYENWFCFLVGYICMLTSALLSGTALSLLILLLVQPSRRYMNWILNILLLNPTWHAKKTVTESDRVLNWIWVMQFKLSNRLAP